MFFESEFNEINNTLSSLLQERRRKLTKVWGFLLVFVIVLIIFFIVLFPKQFENGDTSWILPIYGGIALVGTLVGFLISVGFTSEKPYFEFLFPSIINKINMNEGLYLEYEAYEKQDKEFNREGGLFTSFASVKIRRRVEGYTEEQFKYKIYDCTMTTSNGKSQQVHFDGIYFVLRKQVMTDLQIRSKGSPKRKGVKYTRQDNVDSFKVYKRSSDEFSNLDFKYLRFMDSLKVDLNYKAIYLSVVEGQIHLALTYKKHPCRKRKNLNLDVLNKYANHLLNEIKIVNDLQNIDLF